MSTLGESGVKKVNRLSRPHKGSRVEKLVDFLIENESFGNGVFLCGDYIASHMDDLWEKGPHQALSSLHKAGRAERIRRKSEASGRMLWHYRLTAEYADMVTSNDTAFAKKAKSKLPAIAKKTSSDKKSMPSLAKEVIESIEKPSGAVWVDAVGKIAELEDEVARLKRKLRIHDLRAELARLEAEDS